MQASRPPADGKEAGRLLEELDCVENDLEFAAARELSAISCLGDRRGVPAAIARLRCFETR